MSIFQPRPYAAVWLIAGISMAGLAGCARAPAPGSGDVAALSACRQRADEVYAKQNRAELYNTDTFATSGRDSPYSTGTVADLPTRGLSGEYQRDNMVSDCLAGSGAATGVSTSATPTPSANPPPPGGQP